MPHTFNPLQKRHSTFCCRFALALLLHLVVVGHDFAWGIHGADIFWDSGANIGNWIDPINWSTNSLPDANDSVAIGLDPIAENSWVNLDTIQAVADFEITDGMTLDTNGFPFAAGDSIEIDGRNEILVPAGPVIYSSRLIVDNGIFLEDVVDNRIFVSDGAHLELRNEPRVRIDTYLSVGSSPGGLRAAVSGTGINRFLP